MRVLITGGSGFIGSHLADKLIDRGEEVHVFDSRERSHESRSHFIRGTLHDRYAVADAVRGKDTILHFGAVLGKHETFDDVPGTVGVNVQGSVHVLEAVRQYGNYLLLASKPNVFLSPYSITKDCAEKLTFMYVEEFRVRAAIAKYYNVYGPRQQYRPVRKAVPAWIVNALLGEDLLVFGQGNSTMDLIYIRDAVDATVAIVDNIDRCLIRTARSPSPDVHATFPQYNEQVLEVGTGKATSIIETIDILTSLLDVPVKIQHVPMRSPHRRGELENVRLCANIDRLQRLTGFSPSVSLRHGLAETIDHYKRHLSALRA
jgi:UDP-glucose 4-epimerase